MKNQTKTKDIRITETNRIKRCRKFCRNENKVWFNPILVMGMNVDDLQELSPNLRGDLITKQYRELAKLIHPDKNSHVDAEEAFSTLADSYQMLSDLKIQKCLILTEINARKYVENNNTQKGNKSNRKKNSNNDDILKESLIEERIEDEVKKIYFTFQEKLKKEKEKQIEDQAIILVSSTPIILVPSTPIILVPSTPIIFVPSTISNGDSNNNEMENGINIGNEIDINRKRDKHNYASKSEPNMDKPNKENSLSVNESDMVIDSDGNDESGHDMTSTIYNTSTNTTSEMINYSSSNSEIVTYYTCDLSSQPSPVIINQVGQGGAEHTKNKMPHKKDRHEQGIAARNRQKNAAEKRMKKNGFAFTGKVRINEKDNHWDEI